jgi:hypothetical protein
MGCRLQNRQGALWNSVHKCFVCLSRDPPSIEMLLPNYPIRGGVRMRNSFHSIKVLLKRSRHGTLLVLKKERSLGFWKWEFSLSGFILVCVYNTGLAQESFFIQRTVYWK